MISVCEAAGVPLYVAYYRRGLPKFAHIKQLLDSGVIGEVRFVRSVQLPSHIQQPLIQRIVDELRGIGH